MQPFIFTVTALVLGGALTAGTMALAGLAISAGLRDGRSDLQRRTITFALSLVVGLTVFGYALLATPIAPSAQGVLHVIGGALLIDAALGLGVFGLVLAIHRARAGALRRDAEAEARHRMVMETYRLQLDAWARQQPHP